MKKVRGKGWGEGEKSVGGGELWPSGEQGAWSAAGGGGGGVLGAGEKVWWSVSSGCARNVQDPDQGLAKLNKYRRGGFFGGAVSVLG